MLRLHLNSATSKTFRKLSFTQITSCVTKEKEIVSVFVTLSPILDSSL